LKEKKRKVFSFSGKDKVFEEQETLKKIKKMKENDCFVSNRKWKKVDKNYIDEDSGATIVVISEMFNAEEGEGGVTRGSNK